MRFINTTNNEVILSVYNPDTIKFFPAIDHFIIFEGKKYLVVNTTWDFDNEDILIYVKEVK